MTTALLAPVLSAGPAVTVLAVSSGAFAFGLFVALFVVTVLLWFSMRRHLRRIRFDGADPEAPGTERRDDSA